MSDFDITDTNPVVPMITCQGKLINTYKANPVKERGPDGKETGVLLEGKDKIQIMGNSLMQDGSKRAVMQDFTCHDIAVFKPHLYKDIRFEIGIFSTGDTTILFIPKGTLPQVVGASFPWQSDGEAKADGDAKGEAKSDELPPPAQTGKALFGDKNNRAPAV